MAHTGTLAALLIQPHTSASTSASWPMAMPILHARARPAQQQQQRGARRARGERSGVGGCVRGWRMRGAGHVRGTWRGHGHAHALSATCVCICKGLDTRPGQRVCERGRVEGPAPVSSSLGMGGRGRMQCTQRHHARRWGGAAPQAHNTVGSHAGGQAVYMSCVHHAECPCRQQSRPSMPMPAMQCWVAKPLVAASTQRGQWVPPPSRSGRPLPDAHTHATNATHLRSGSPCGQLKLISKASTLISSHRPMISSHAPLLHTPERAVQWRVQRPAWGGRA